jgi:hypothetical protein
MRDVSAGFALLHVPNEIVLRVIKGALAMLTPNVLQRVYGKIGENSVSLYDETVVILRETIGVYKDK